MSPPARVADLACGAGHSSIAIARAYPRVLVEGSIWIPPRSRRTRENLAGSGVEDSVSFVLGDAASPRLAGRYDLVTLFEALHDMWTRCRCCAPRAGLLAGGGCVIVADERVADSFSAPGDDVERLYYGFSVLHCLPVGMPGAGTGAVMRVDTVRSYALDAGFAGVEVLPIDNDFWRFYRLTA